MAADYARLGALLTELGKRTADLGVPLVHHNKDYLERQLGLAT